MDFVDQYLTTRETEKRVRIAYPVRDVCVAEVDYAGFGRAQAAAARNSS